MSASLHPYRLAWSFRFGRIFGIDLKVHLIFLIFVGWFSLRAWIQTGSLVTGAYILFLFLLIFAFVLLHELGHSLMAQRHGIRVRDITLWPLGGLARLEGVVKDPNSELRIAIAGPAVNLILAGITYPFLFLPGSPSIIESLLELNFMITIPLGIFWANLIMGVFNLIPAFPMDGGRILRALAAGRLPYIKATEIAVRIGRYLAWAGIIGGALYSSFWLILISLFVLWAGSAELRAARALEAMRTFKGWASAGDSPTIDAEVVSTDEGGPLKPHEKEFINLIRHLNKPDDRS